MATGRPKKEFDKKTFQDLVGLGCNQEEICWFFRDETGKPANIDTLTRWCKREFDMTFSSNGGGRLNIANITRLAKGREEAKQKLINEKKWDYFVDEYPILKGI